MGGKKKAVTVGYRYYLGLHFGACHGPVDALLEVEVGDRTAWTGSQTASGAISVSAPNLFGGDSREGGIVGTLDVMMGEPAQASNSYLASKQGTPQPAYRGILGFVYRGGQIAANNPYVKPWAFRVRRLLKGWHNDAPWYSAKASIDVGGGLLAANPAHIVYECLTNPEWGLGYPSTQIDNSSFTAAADAFYAEGLGLCIAWSQQDSIQNFIQIVMDHSGAVLSQDQTTGLFKLKALRADYSIGSLPVFSDTAGNVIRLERIERGTQTEALNEVSIAYVDAATGRDGSITVQNLAIVQAQGAVVAQTRQYPGIPTSALAARIGMRDLKAASSGLARVQFTATRAAYTLAPGDVIAFSWGPSGVSLMPLRVTRIDYGSLTDGEIRIEGLEDVFGLPATAYADPPPVGWVPPNYEPEASPATLVVESTYRDVYQSAGATDAADAALAGGYVVAAAARPLNNLALNYYLETRVGTASYTRRGLGDWAPSGTLVSGIGPTDTTISLASATDFEGIEIGTAAMIGTGTTAEIVRIDGINAGLQQLTIARGCVDTVPRSWAGGTRVFFHELHAIGDEIEYALGESVSARFITLSPNGELASGSAPSGSVTIADRAVRPYPPGQFKIDGVYYPAAGANSIVVSWVGRDRILQADQLVDYTQGAIGPEAGTTYRVRYLNDANGAVLLDATGISGGLHQYSGSFTGNLRVELRAVRDGLDSWQFHEHVISFTGLALSWTPANLTGVDVWFDADDLSSFTLSGSQITQWNDKGALAVHADTPGASTTRPTLATGALNGRSVARFNGSQFMRMAYGTNGINPTPAKALFKNKGAGFAICVVRANPADTTTSTNRFIFQFTTNTDQVTRFGLDYNRTTRKNAPHLATRRLDADSAAILVPPTERGTAWNIVAIAIDWTNNDAFLWENGTLTASNTAHGTAGSTSNTDSLAASIGGVMDSATSTTVHRFRGDLAELIIADEIFSTANRQRLEGYLAHKWGLTANLPADHPWKVIPPVADVGGYIAETTDAATLAADGEVS